MAARRRSIAAGVVHDHVRHAQRVEQLQRLVSRKRPHRLRRLLEAGRRKAAVAIDERMAVTGRVDQVLGVAEERAPIVERHLDDDGVRLVAEHVVDGRDAREGAVPQGARSTSRLTADDDARDPRARRPPAAPRRVRPARSSAPTAQRRTPRAPPSRPAPSARRASSSGSRPAPARARGARQSPAAAAAPTTRPSRRRRPATCAPAVRAHRRRADRTRPGRSRRCLGSWRQSCC